MGARETAVDLAAGIIGGIVATQVNDFVEHVFLAATPAREKAREPETEDGSSARAAARMLLTLDTDDPPEKRIEALQKGIHFGLGAAWGPVYCWLRRHTPMPPVVAGVASGAALSLIVDETLNPLLGITPPRDAYPKSAHIRGFATHAVWGLVCGATAEFLRRRWGT